MLGWPRHWRLVDVSRPDAFARASWWVLEQVDSCIDSHNVGLLQYETTSIRAAVCQCSPIILQLAVVVDIFVVQNDKRYLMSRATRQCTHFYLNLRSKDQRRSRAE